jgi:DNA-binding protein HU-beta
MNQSEVIAAVSAKTGLSQKTVRSTLEALAATVQSGLSFADGAVRIVGLGNFTRFETAARTGRNPRTGETVQIAARSKVRFSPSSALRAALNSSK